MISIFPSRPKTDASILGCDFESDIDGALFDTRHANGHFASLFERD
jgi:hypothetical protein